jgi:hypothetical protein
MNNILIKGHIKDFSPQGKFNQRFFPQGLPLGRKLSQFFGWPEKLLN